MLANILLFLGGIIAGLALTEQHLTDAQKAHLSTSSVSLWNAVDELTKLSVSDWLALPKVRKTLLVIATVVPSIVLLVRKKGQSTFPISDPTMALFLLILLIPIVFRWGAKGIDYFISVKTKPIRQRAFVAFLVPSPIFLLAIFIEVTKGAELTRLGEIVYLFLTVLSFSTLAIFIAMLFPVAVCQNVPYAIKTAEFVIRWVAQSPKGPMLAVGALLGAAAALLKFFE